MENFNEVWRPIVGVENKYMVSNKGEVVSLNFRRSGVKKEMAYRLHNGYKHISLCINGKMKNIQIHRLVAMAFIPNPNNYPCINHKDEDKLNNFVYVNEDGSVDLEKSNLEWCTAAYNTTYGTAIQRRSEKSKVPILQMTIDGNLVGKFNSAKEAGESLGVINTSSITAVCKGKQKTAFGYKWRYEDEDRYSESLQTKTIIEQQKSINYKQGGLKHSKKVCQFTLEGELLNEFASCLIAAKETGICKGSIQQNCGGYRKKTHGYVFKYKEDLR